MIFLNTSAIYAMADRNDPHHERATRGLQAALDAGEEIVTHNYVLVDSMALLQNRLGTQAAIHLARDARAFRIEWVDEATHEAAVRRLAREGKRRASFVDMVSFLVMRRRGVRTALAFDPDFESEGFQLFARPGEETPR
jgi:predicted nucleic acid-binding protein